MRSIAIIQDEHRSITAVIEGLREVLAEIEAAQLPPDFELIGAMLRYIAAFPERLHHPKEDEYLFARLRLRRPDASPLLDRLRAEHEQGRVRFGALQSALEQYRRDTGSLPSFRDQVDRYAAFHWRHMRQEEDEVLPLAAEALTAEDWAAIDAAFAANADPTVGIGDAREFRALFRHIVAIAPPPLGVGPAPRATSDRTKG